MELRDYVRIIHKQVRLILVTILLCLFSAALISLATTPIYQGAAKLLLVAKSDPGGDTSSAYEGALLSQQLAKSFAQIIESRSTAEAALRLDPQPFTSQQLQEKIDAEPITNTLLIDLRVEDTDPTRARRLTNSVARAFITTVPHLQSGSTLRVSLVEPALTPTTPIRPRVSLNVALGLVLGVILGGVLAFLREFLDHSVKSAEELESAAGAPLVGTIPPFRASKQPTPVVDQPRLAPAEAFRKLRTNFAFLGIERECVCCVITSPSAADGKSTVAANLAISLAQSGRRVAIVDADLRRPTMHTLFHLHQRIGTTTVLLDQALVSDAIQQLGIELPDVLTSGQLPPNPSELLGSGRMRTLIAELRASYEVVLIDCPPILPVTDPMVVSRFADGILLIARATTTTRDQVKAARAACNKAGATIFGTVLNASPITEGGPAYAYYGDPRREHQGVHASSQNLLAGSPMDSYEIRATRASRRGRRIQRTAGGPTQ